MTSSKWFAGVSLLALVLGGVAVYHQVVPPVQIAAQCQQLGGQLYENSLQKFYQGFGAGAALQTSVATSGALTTSARATFDGGVLISSTLSTSSQGAVTYTAANLAETGTVLHNATAALTATLPASTTLSTLVPNAGDRRNIVIANVGTAALTLAGGTGTLLTRNASTTIIYPGFAATISVVRKTNTDVIVTLTGN